jgi:hypothetical protein
LRIAAAKLLSPDEVDALTFDGMDRTAPLRNPLDVQPASLPLELELFNRVPIVLTARFFAESAKPTRAHARLYLQ